MAEIRPLRAWRYHSNLTPQLGTLTAPLFDVISNEQRRELYRNPLNSVHLSVPDGYHPAKQVAALVDKWKTDQTIVQDDLPGIYVYYQYFRLPDDEKEYCRKGFIANLRIYDWDEEILLRHENTMPFSVEDRINILGASQMNISPTHGLYSDENQEVEKYLDEAMTNPIYEVEDYQGVKDVLSVIHDVKVIKRIVDLLSSKQIILADGHHRYEGSLLYKKKRQAGNDSHMGDEGYNYHLMYFTNTESDDLRVLPTHRLVSGLIDFKENEIIPKLENYFLVKEITNPQSLEISIHNDSFSFGIVLGSGTYKLQLKTGLEKKIPWKFPDAIKELDLTVMHYYIIEKALGIEGKDQRTSRLLSFERSTEGCIDMVERGEAQVAILTREISIDTIKEVCFSGATLPQKSTYFYPKAICGFLFGSIHADEFHSNFESFHE